MSSLLQALFDAKVDCSGSSLHVDGRMSDRRRLKRGGEKTILFFSEAGVAKGGWGR